MLWSEKHKPQSHEQIVGQDAFKALLLGCHHDLPNLLLHGPSGTGKSSSVNVLVNTLYGGATRGNILRINASDTRGIGSVRDVINEFTRTGNAITLGASRVKLVILEEADNLTLDAQCCLRRLMELNCASARFLLVCNFVDKLLPAIQSRCSTFRFTPLSHAAVVNHLDSIAVVEGVHVSRAGLAKIVRCAQGDLRRAINQLQTMSCLGGSHIGEELFTMALGVPEQSFVEELNTLRGRSLAETCEQLQRAVSRCRLTSTAMLAAVFDGLREVLTPDQLVHLADLQVIASLDHDDELLAMAAAAVIHTAPSPSETLSSIDPSASTSALSSPSQDASTAAMPCVKSSPRSPSQPGSAP
jgi:replication factor C subunit 3/5